MSTRSKLQRLYEAIPAFECRPGCTDCCGPVPWAPAEWAALTDQRRLEGTHCPYGQAGKCDIYAQRPFICRIFGASTDPRLKCPHGYAPQRPLTKARADELTDRWMKLGGRDACIPM